MENTTDAPGRSVASTGDAWTTGSDTPHRRASAPPLSHRDQMLAALFGLWMIVGLFLDGWAHDNQKPESFSTPWRGVLYSGFTAAGLFALHRAARGHVSGRPWHDTMPRGHGLTLAAFGVFAVAASGDLVWHQVFGIEVGLEALPQPHPPPLDGKWAGCAQRAHPSVVGRARRSALAAGCLSRWRRRCLTALVAFFRSFFSPFSNNAGSTAFNRFPGQLHTHPSTDVGELQQLLGVGSILLMSVVLAAAVAFLLRRWRVPAGTLTLLFGLVVLLFVATDEFAQPLVVLTGLAPGATGDLLTHRRLAPAVVSGAAVAVLWLAYFALYALDEGSVAWAAELWAGSAFLGTLLAVGIGLLVTPRVPVRCE